MTYSERRAKAFEEARQVKLQEASINFGAWCKKLLDLAEEYDGKCLKSADALLGAAFAVHVARGVIDELNAMEGRETP